MAGFPASPCSVLPAELVEWCSWRIADGYCTDPLEGHKKHYVGPLAHMDLNDPPPRRLGQSRVSHSDRPHHPCKCCIYILTETHNPRIREPTPGPFSNSPSKYLGDFVILQQRAPRIPPNILTPPFTLGS
jgi:hypothetical protein